jgi:hypothetical protein
VHAPDEESQRKNESQQKYGKPPCHGHKNITRRVWSQAIMITIKKLSRIFCKLLKQVL